MSQQPHQSQQPDVVFVPIPAELYSEFILRKGQHVSVAAYAANIIADFLGRTRGDADIWSEAHAAQVAAEQEAEHAHGDPSKGYQWQTVFLPNGTRVRMPYQGRNHYAVVEHERIVYEGQSFSPSEFASAVAGGTSRNAWRDLWLLFPGRREWHPADIVRKGGAP